MNNKKKPFPFESFRHFSKRELQDFLEVFHYSVEAKTDEEIKYVLGQIRKVFPCEFIIAGVAAVGPLGNVQEFSHLLNESYPNDWLYHYAKNGYAEVDPVLVSHAKNFQTQVWSSTYKTAGSKKEEEFIEHARSFGLAGGVTAGAFDSQRGLCSFFSFAGTNKAENPHYAGALEYLAHHLHYPLVQNTPSPSPVMAFSLSPRELSVLKWMTQGKTNWEISRILGVTERTVRFHVEGIFCKLDVTSRTQAVAMAVENRMISHTA
ncbi:MAG: autoinducer binding domain-containing protein [Nitrospirota bacterium]|nr:MAG: autoinducer binding domain-containing protein [Nitrospirota bacterium]